MGQILFNRGISQEEYDSFLSPDFDRDLHDPFLLDDMEKAVNRIFEAKEKDQKIGIFSDYDADGIPGAALLHRGFEKIGIRTETYIPNRENGYGLSKEGIDYLISKKCELIITIDLGIRSIEEAKYCKEKSLDLIITDHHIPAEELPDSFALINPKKKESKYPFADLCGCGVAYKLLSALKRKFKVIDDKFLKWNLDLVAISTMADVVSLVGENRVLATYGLKVLNKTRNVGLKELVKISGLEGKELGAYHVGFQLAPRINAPGRIDHATKSYELLITDEDNEAKELAAWLDEKNLIRQRQMDTVESETISQINEGELLENNIIIASGEWPKGVIGPTASRIVEKFSRPVILFSESDDNYTGSARSVEGVHILDLLDKVGNLIIKYGGHSGAAGLSVSQENYEIFVKNLTKIANKEIDKKLLDKTIKLDAMVNEKEISMKLYELIKRLEPFGMGNARPVFGINNAQIAYGRKVGKGQNHYSFKTKIGDRLIKSIYFNKTIEDELLKQNASLAFSVDLDSWNGKEEVSLNIIDVK